MLERIADTATSLTAVARLARPPTSAVGLIATVIQNNASADGLGFARSPRMFRARVTWLFLWIAALALPCFTARIGRARTQATTVLSVICMLLD